MRVLWFRRSLPWPGSAWFPSVLERSLVVEAPREGSIPDGVTDFLKSIC